MNFSGAAKGNFDEELIILATYYLAGLEACACARIMILLHAAFMTWSSSFELSYDFLTASIIIGINYSYDWELFSILTVDQVHPPTQSRNQKFFYVTEM